MLNTGRSIAALWPRVVFFVVVISALGADAQTPNGPTAIAEEFALSVRAEVPQVLFIGNSFTQEHDLPALVAAWASGFGVEIDVATIATGGHQLHLHATDTATRDAVANHDWDVLVLQDFSTEALTADGRARSRRAAQRLASLSDAVLVMFATWPRAKGHRLYDQPWNPRDPADMYARIEAHYAELSDALDGILAPVGGVFVGRDEFYRRDKYHASEQGAAAAAEVLARAVVEALGLDDHLPPLEISAPGVTSPATDAVAAE